MATLDLKPSEMPHKFNFAVDVIDKWADQRDDLQAMHWVSQDESNTRHMTFKYFSRQSHRIAILLDHATCTPSALSSAARSRLYTPRALLLDFSRINTIGS